MNSPQTLSTAETAKRNRIAELAEQLQSVRTSRFKDYWSVYLVGLCYAAIALMQGRKFLLLYFGALMIVLMLREATIRRVDRQIDAVVVALRDLQNNNGDHDDNAA